MKRSHIKGWRGEAVVSDQWGKREEEESGEQWLVASCRMRLGI